MILRWANRREHLIEPKSCILTRRCFGNIFADAFRFADIDLRNNVNSRRNRCLNRQLGLKMICQFISFTDGEK